ncbi:ribonuclease J [Patescibacteria group bacterium]|nr:ribonuclease J [Patescibacteria group bacterium]MBU1730529.1 ribonuclease J [Patescibacteria group bacterium]MBU1956096.1 ribonuclease J [Patescibacteria group bacterium]MBU2010330.1 ribonuclease J [Patescibacteria group bacterium]MBU2416656.1 ribonuclease J [Patescibacteria group bacterium]
MINQNTQRKQDPIHRENSTRRDFVVGRKGTHSSQRKDVKPIATQKTQKPQRQYPSIKESPFSQAKKRARPFVAGTKEKNNETKVRPHIKVKTGGHKIKQNRSTPKHTGINTKTKVIIPELKTGYIRVIPIGGVEEVGKNMTIVETTDDIFVFDVGLQFSGDEETPGVDYIIPNTTYLEERKNKIRGIFITHGHLDHIGGIPFILNRIGNPPIYTANLTSLLIKKRNEEFPDLKNVSITPFNPGERMKIGKTYIRSFPVNHSIPDAMGFSIETPLGNIIISGDLRLDHTGGIPSEKEEKVYGELSTHNNLFFICDSTNAEQTGYSTDEHTVITNLEKFIKEANNRMIIGTFASQFSRMIKIIQLAEKYNKKVATEGRGIKTNIEIAERAEMFTPKAGTLITSEAMSDYPPDKIIVLATGAQGEEFAALMRIATDQHKTIKLNARDTVLLSSSVIPGNELSVQKLKDKLTRHGVRLINYRTTDIHTSGHGNIEELLWINRKIHSKFFMPGYGFHSMLRSHSDAIIRSGFPKENVIIPDNGSIIEFTDTKEMVLLKEKASSGIVAVDGLRVGDIQDAVMRDRKTLTKDGIFVIVATINSKTRKIQKSPDIISRGFVYLRESQALLQQARYITQKTIEKNIEQTGKIDYDDIKNQVTEKIKKFLLQQTNKRPMVLPVILGF